MSSEKNIIFTSYDYDIKMLSECKNCEKLTIYFLHEVKIDKVQLNNLLKVIPTLKTVEIIGCPSFVKVIWLPRNITKFIGTRCCFVTKVYGSGLNKVKLDKSRIYISDKSPITHIWASDCNDLGNILFTKLDSIRLENCARFNIGRCFPSYVMFKMCKDFYYYEISLTSALIMNDKDIFNNNTRINSINTRINNYLPNFVNFIKTRLLLLKHKRNVALKESLGHLPKDLVSIISNFNNKNIKPIKDGF
jgi:hypothetical protein